MSEVLQCDGCGQKSIFVYKCNKCGEIRCFFPLCKGNKGSDKEGAAKTGLTCFSCGEGIYEKIS